jgi:hypothetical protein
MSHAHQTPARLTEEDLVAKYGKKRIIQGTLRFNRHLNKQVVKIRTYDRSGRRFDGNTRVVATSDLFQVKHTPEVMAQIRAARRASR